MRSVQEYGKPPACPFCGMEITRADEHLNYRHPPNDACFIGEAVVPLDRLDRWLLRTAPRASDLVNAACKEGVMRQEDLQPVGWRRMNRQRTQSTGITDVAYYADEWRKEGDIVEPLYARPSALREWQPFATAPQDGTRFDAWCVHPETGGMGGRITDVQMRGDKSGFGFIVHLADGVSWQYLDARDGGIFPAWEATHWMARPDGPAREEAGDRRDCRR